MFARVLQKYAIYFGFLAIFAVFSVLSPHFLQGQNLSNILVQASVMASSRRPDHSDHQGHDLSVGSIGLHWCRPCSSSIPMPASAC
jgi:ABC-type glucose/galactose transport system permease subunit